MCITYSVYTLRLPEFSMHASSPRMAIQGIFHSSHKKRARAFWTQFYESQLLSFLASNLPLVSALLSTVHCFCHMQASSIALFAATSSAHTARRVCSQLAVPPVACQLSRALWDSAQLDCSSLQIKINKSFLASLQKNCLPYHLHYSPTVASAFCQKSFGSICLTLVYRCCQKNQSTVFDIGPTFV